MSEPISHAPARPRNRLAREKSPYLLQHASNPVDWFPWGEEAFERARREDRPIFLSIGYSTCHWCHVMERESFESEAIAEQINAGFVAVKVDREERPDVDRLYMTAAQAMGVGGGWPLHLFLTPELEPFYGGTYFPPEARHGRAGIRDVLAGIHAAWSERRDEIRASGARVLEALEGVNAAGAATPVAFEALEEQAWQWLGRSRDAAHGGFGQPPHFAPKFPSVVNLDFLTRSALAHPERRAEALTWVRGQLDAMRRGGIHDQIGGGFHRYSVDREWLVPHFEKMLYDQAQLAWAFLEAHQLTGETAYSETARGIFDYVARDLSSPGGGFLSAEDADSEGVEGRFYVWTPAQLDAALGAEAAAEFAAVYDVTAAGNFEGESILNERTPPEHVAVALGVEVAGLRSRLAAARAKLLDVRATRTRPHLDDKVLTAWNGLMTGAFARGARVLDAPELAARATRAAEFAWRTLRDPATGALARRWRDGETAGAGQLDDHAYLAWGYLELFMATQAPEWLERAVELTERQWERFWDDEAGGFFESPAGDASVRIRMKDAFDGAEIAGNSIAAWNLQMLGGLLDREPWLEGARRTFEHFSRRLGAFAAGMPRMLVAMDLAREAPRHVVIAGDAAAADTQAMMRAWQRRFRPRELLLVVSEGESRRRLSQLVPFVQNLSTRDGRATAYVCVDRSCRLPATDPAAFEAELDATDPLLSQEN